MRELSAIVEACNSLDAGADLPALATVVRVEGSAYRRPGARMFVYPDGRRVGTVSGGCLESDVARHALQVLQTGEPEYILYDKRNRNGDVVAELGCNGSVGVLIEPAGSTPARECLRFLASFGGSRERGAVATVFQTEGACTVRPGDRLMARWSDDGPEYQTIGRDPAIPLSDLWEAVRSEQAFSRSYPAAGGMAEVLIEPILPSIALLLCGAGQDTVPLAQMARLLGWQVVMAEDLSAPDWPAELRASTADGLICADPRVAAVVMTHNYSRDLAWLKALLPANLGYIGLLGPRHRSLRLLGELEADGSVLTQESMARLYAPAGLDLGAETPQEIAVAIIAEIQAVLHGRSGGLLRERTTPIHARSEFEPIVPRMQPLPVKAASPNKGGSDNFEPGVPRMQR